MNENSSIRWDRVGSLRRARRIADLSQRELAARIGVGHATVSRAESGLGAVSLAVVEAILQVADLRLAVVNSEGQLVEPMRADTVRDAAGRHLPAHLDAELPGSWTPAGNQWHYSRPTPTATYRPRDRRNYYYARYEQRRHDPAFAGLTGHDFDLAYGMGSWSPCPYPGPQPDPADRPADHPTIEELADRKRRRRELYRERRRLNRHPVEPAPECECGPECECYCDPGCSCQCEPHPASAYEAGAEVEAEPVKAEPVDAEPVEAEPGLAEPEAGSTDCTGSGKQPGSHRMSEFSPTEYNESETPATAPREGAVAGVSGGVVTPEGNRT